jgi:hypothetical protein
MGIQAVIKTRCKTAKLFALHASPYKESTPYWILLTLKIIEVLVTKFSISLTPHADARENFRI